MVVEMANQSANTALELLTNNELNRIEPFINKYWGFMLGAGLGFGAAIAINVGSKRPPFSGIQKHIYLPIICGAVTGYLEHRRVEYYNERDAVLRHYVELHPEDFPMPERKKFADVLKEWVPIR